MTPPGHPSAPADHTAFPQPEACSDHLRGATAAGSHHRRWRPPYRTTLTHPVEPLRNPTDTTIEKAALAAGQTPQRLAASAE
ncbi:MAG: hypothetical protein KatS3mg060_2388 [Dehalococcoidia bacterium]|nr:MAG: hypothetical protein KatS3mg060_2388 [Dehalococcoidia bacterium]